MKTVLILAAHLGDKDDFLRRHANAVNNELFSFKNTRFTFDSQYQPDAVVVFNTPPKKNRFKVNRLRLYGFMMEPGNMPVHLFMQKANSTYHHLFSPIAPKPSHGYLGWQIELSYDELKALKPFEKIRSLSSITSDKLIYEGHYKRLSYLTALVREGLNFDLFGKGFGAVENKSEALLNYSYSIVIENSTRPHYFTEKLNDALLCWTVPFYVGPKNIGEYFPADAIIQLPDDNPRMAIKIIQSELADKRNYAKRLQSMAEARSLILDTYNPLAKIDALVNSADTKSTDSDEILIKYEGLPIFILKGYGTVSSFIYRLKSRLTKEIDFPLLLGLSVK